MRSLLPPTPSREFTTVWARPAGQPMASCADGFGVSRARYPCRFPYRGSGCGTTWARRVEPAYSALSGFFVVLVFVPCVVSVSRLRTEVAARLDKARAEGKPRRGGALRNLTSAEHVHLAAAAVAAGVPRPRRRSRAFDRRRDDEPSSPTRSVGRGGAARDARGRGVLRRAAAVRSHVRPRDLRAPGAGLHPHRRRRDVGDARRPAAATMFERC